jgi:hypothetical protein
MKIYVPWFMRSVAGSHRNGQGSIPVHVMWDLWWIKWHWGELSLSTSNSPANSHSTDRGWYNSLNSGLLTNWTQAYNTKLLRADNVRLWSQVLVSPHKALSLSHFTVLVAITSRIQLSRVWLSGSLAPCCTATLPRRFV